MKKTEATAESTLSSSEENNSEHGDGTNGGEQGQPPESPENGEPAEATAKTE